MAMGVGLHSYGFAAGIMRTLYIFWTIEGFFLAAAIGVWAYKRFSGGSGPKTPPLPDAA